MLTFLLLLVQPNWLLQVVATPLAAQEQEHINHQSLNEQSTSSVPEHVSGQEENYQTHHNMQRKQQISDPSIEIPCHHAITTPPITNRSSVMSAYGILFTLSSPYYSTQSSNKEMVISTLGFYVDTDKLNSITDDVNFEVYTLQGHYADPDRSNEGNGGLPLDPTWDYRGNTAYWEMIAEGGIGMDDLGVWPPDANSVDDMTKSNYFQIPFDKFQPTTIPSKTDGLTSGKTNEVQSFYVTLREVGALLYMPIESWEDLHDDQSALYCETTRTVLASKGTTNLISGDLPGVCVDGDGVDDQPVLHIGEGVASYPFPDVPFFYQPDKFMGSLYYLNDCPTAPPSSMPSISSNPSSTVEPSNQPTIAETMKPSHSLTPTLVPRSPPPTPYSHIYAGQDGCHSSISTDRNYGTFKNETSSSYGIVFPIKSNEDDGDGVWITSLGFHVDFSTIPPLLDDSNSSNTLDYEVYALVEEGLYADPNRTSTAGPPETFDYRGDFTLWKNISAGTIIEDDDLVDDDYFQIPWVQFEPTFIPQSGGIRSFYLTISDAGALVYMDLEKPKWLGRVQRDDFYNINKDKTQHPPTLLYGEGIIGYPFHATSFLYSPKHFIGKVFYEHECPSQAPSSAPTPLPSDSPSLMPSQSPSQQPSSEPSALPSGSPSSLPSSMPSLSPTDTPSSVPSIIPTFTVSPTQAEFPSIPPTSTTQPSNMPSSHPTISQRPSSSPQPSPRPILPQWSSATFVTSSLNLIVTGVLSLALVLYQ